MIRRDQQTDKRLLQFQPSHIPMLGGSRFFPALLFYYPYKENLDGQGLTRTVAKSVELG
jgi:hypothetical protein